jgi:RNA polymerase nonessential primary-like sigma factor
MKGSGVTVSFHASDMVTKVRRTRAKLNENLQREPTTEEISRKSGLSEFSVNSALVNQTTLISIDAPVNGQADNVNSTLLREILPDEANTEERAFRSLLVNHLLKSIYSMPKRMRTVILHRYGLDDHEVLTLDVLSKQFGVSKTTIQNDEKAAILELRNSLFSWIGLIS